MSATPARPAEAEDSGVSAGPTVVRFHLPVDDGWPPEPTEVLAAEVVREGLVRLLDVPVFADGVSAGDVMSVSGPGEAGPVVSRGRHSTIRVAASARDELDEPRALSEDLGCRTRTSADHAMLSVDVPDRVAIEDVLVLLDSRCSATLTYTVTCLQHRITPMSPGDLGHGQESLHALASQVRGRVVRPGDEDWDTARQAWNLAVDQRPALVVEVADAFDVQAVVRHAGENDLRVAPQGTGHNAAPLGDLSDAILLRTGRLDAIDVDAEQGMVRVGAGVIWADVAAALAPHGLAALAGSSPDVGVAGYTLGGGYSWLGRRYGLAASSVRAVELVTGDGAFHRVDAENEPDLFWAVRGGGANVGVVCALELDVYPVADVYAGALLFPLTRGSEILSAYEEWTRGLDEAATTCIRLLRVPPLPDIPEPLRGNAFVMIDGAVDGTDAEAAALLAPLRGLGPAIDSFARMPTSQLSVIHMDPPQPVPAVGDGLSLAELTPETIDVLVKHAGPDADTALLAVDLRHLGGALGRPDPGGGAVDHLPGRFLLFAVGIAPAPEVAATVQAQVDALVAELQPWASAVDYLNFRERPVEPGRLYPRPRLNRLRAVRDLADPGGLLAANHPIG
ncbi:MAG: FAD-binding protein [Actinomycetales bacterium]